MTNLSQKARRYHKDVDMLAKRYYVRIHEDFKVIKIRHDTCWVFDEVIVIDNTPSMETPLELQLLTGISNLSILRMKRNTGIAYALTIHHKV